MENCPQEKVGIPDQEQEDKPESGTERSVVKDRNMHITWPQ